MTLIQKKISNQLNSLQEAKQLRQIPDIDFGAQLCTNFQGQKVLNLASNNYLGLAESNLLKQGAIQATQLYGTSSGASRLVTGNFSLYDQLEQELAKFKKQEAAIVIGSGYAANLALCQVMADRKTTVFSDRLNHASIIDGIALSRAKHVRYRHNDMDHLLFLLQKHKNAPLKLLITDSVFSMDGDRANLERIVRLCKDFKVLSAIDEAHATGILGKGRGLAHELGLQDEIDLHMSTFSKALGSYGAFICGRQKLIQAIINSGRSFIFSTSLPPAVIGANLAAIKAVQEDNAQALLQMSDRLRTFLKAQGFETGLSSTQIIPIILGGNEKTLQARDFLLSQKILVSAIRPPTVQTGTSRLRLALRADMGEQEIQQIKTGFVKLKKYLETLI